MNSPPSRPTGFFWIGVFLFTVGAAMAITSLYEGEMRLTLASGVVLACCGTALAAGPRRPR